MPQEPETFPIVMVIVLVTFLIGYIAHRISMVFPEFRKRILAMHADCESRINDAESGRVRLEGRLAKLAERLDPLTLAEARAAMESAGRYIGHAESALRGIWTSEKPEETLSASSADAFPELRRTIFLDQEQQAIGSARNAQFASKNGNDLCDLLEQKLADADSDLVAESDSRRDAEDALAEAASKGVLCPEAEADIAAADALRRRAQALIGSGFIRPMEEAYGLLVKAGVLHARAKRSAKEIVARVAGLREDCSLLGDYLEAAEAELAEGFERQTGLMTAFAPASWIAVKGNVAKARECRLGASRLKTQADRELEAGQWEHAGITLGRALALIGRMKFLLDSVSKRLHYLSGLKRGFKEAADNADTDISLAMEYLRHASQEQPSIDEPRLSGLVREARAIAANALADYPEAYAKLHEALSEVREVWNPVSLSANSSPSFFKGLGTAGAEELVQDAKAASEDLRRFAVVHEGLPEKAFTADCTARHLIERAKKSSGKEAIALYARALDTARSGLGLALAADTPFSEPVMSRPKPFEPIVMVI